MSEENISLPYFRSSLSTPTKVNAFGKKISCNVVCLLNYFSVTYCEQIKLKKNNLPFWHKLVKLHSTSTACTSCGLVAEWRQPGRLTSQCFWEVHCQYTALDGITSHGICFLWIKWFTLVHIPSWLSLSSRRSKEGAADLSDINDFDFESVLGDTITKMDKDWWKVRSYHAGQVLQALSPHFVDYSQLEFVAILDILDKCKKGHFPFRHHILKQP